MLTSNRTRLPSSNATPSPGHFKENRPMIRTHGRTVSIVTGHGQSQLSKGQKAFNTLISQIDKKRARLAAWEAAIPPYQQKYVSQLAPLVEDLADLQVRLVHCLE